MAVVGSSVVVDSRCVPGSSCTIHSGGNGGVVGSHGGSGFVSSGDDSGVMGNGGGNSVIGSDDAINSDGSSGVIVIGVIGGGGGSGDVSSDGVVGSCCGSGISSSGGVIGSSGVIGSGGVVGSNSSQNVVGKGGSRGVVGRSGGSGVPGAVLVSSCAFDIMLDGLCIPVIVLAISKACNVFACNVNGIVRWCFACTIIRVRVYVSADCGSWVQCKMLETSELHCMAGCL